MKKIRLIAALTAIAAVGAVPAAASASSHPSSSVSVCSVFAACGQANLQGNFNASAFSQVQQSNSSNQQIGVGNVAGNSTYQSQTITKKSHQGM
jgi:hypothetical protein